MQVNGLLTPRQDYIGREEGSLTKDEYIEDEKISFNYIKKENLTGSCNGMRYLLKKQEEKLLAVIWPEPFCFEVTKEEEKTYQDFELTVEGKTKAVGWLNEQYLANKDKWLLAKKYSFYL